ncbi:MAG: DUF6036 family nucleotidyltransferase [bacterium]
MYPLQVITAFDDYLSQQCLKFSAIIVGGCALSLLGIITRETQDVDVLDPNIPQEILKLSYNFANDWNSKNQDTLKVKWLNNGPVTLQRDLPKKWRERIEPLFIGKSLSLYTLHRSDLLLSKLFAYCDRGTDRGDCIRLCPSHEELIQAFDWIKKLDGNSLWPSHVEAMFKELAKELGYEL